MRIRKHLLFLVLFLLLMFCCTLALAGAWNPTPLSGPLSILWSSPSPSPTQNLLESPTVDAAKEMATPSPQSEPSITDVPIPERGRLEGMVFFDYDGDGLQGDEEPGVEQAWVCIYLTEGDFCSLSADNGAYALEGFPAGVHQVFVFSPNDDPVQAFRYINLFKGWVEIDPYALSQELAPRQRLPETELRPIHKPLEVKINAATRLELALMQGYLTDIFHCGTRQGMNTFQGVDLDPRQGYVRHYYEMESRTSGLGTYLLRGDNHFAIDWGDVNQHIIGTPILAAANGVVSLAGDTMTWNGMCRMVKLAHPETGESSGYVHLETVLVRELQQVYRGQVIGTLGSSCTTWPHVHFVFHPAFSQIRDNWEGGDPYRDTANPDSFTTWTKDNAPQCPAFLGNAATE